MNTKNTISENINANTAEELRTPADSVNYSEIPGLTSPSIDILNQFQSNMKLLGDLHFRLQFMMNEIKSVLRK